MLLRKGILKDSYYCDLTTLLDDGYRYGINSDFRHYVLAGEFHFNKGCLPFRIPGKTVGGIWIDENNVVTKIAINDDCLKDYVSDLNDLLEMNFLGEEILLGN